MKRRGLARVLASLLVIVIYISAAAFSLRGESLEEPGNPIEDLEEEADEGTASMLSSYLPKSQEIIEEMGQKDPEDTQDLDHTSQDVKDNSGSENFSQEAEEAQEGEGGGGGADEQGANEQGGTGQDGRGGAGGNKNPGNSRGEGKEDEEGQAQNFFTTSIIDGETVTTPTYSFTITQLQKEIPLLETKVYVNKEDVGQFNGKVPLTEGDNSIKVTCSYQKNGGKKFSVSRSYTVILDTANIVFFTNLEDGITVSRPDFTFTAYAQYRGEEIPLAVKVNGIPCEKAQEGNDYEAVLKKEDNSIVFEAETEDGKTQTKTYTVHVKLRKAAILTDLGRLAETEAVSPHLEFYASVLETDMGTEHPAEVAMNGKALESSDFNYQVELAEGENVFTVDGTSVNRDIETETYVIYYYAPAAGLEIRTDLEPEMKVSDPAFEFYAYARDSQSMVKLEVTVNGRPAEANKNHYYSVGLQANDNSIVLTADNGVDRKVQEYIVTYEPKNASNPVEDDNPPKPGEEEDVYAPSITSPDLYDNMKVKGSTLVFTIKAVDYQGKKLSSGYLTLKLNGYSSGISLVWDDNTKTSYRLKLNPGENELSIKVSDPEGHSKSFLIHITSEAVSEGTPIGRARFSIDASVLGMGFLVPPTDVDLYDGENIAYVLNRFLKENGFTYNSTGTLATGFYLARINKKGLLNSLDAGMKEEYAGRYNEDGLGEFDFTNGSGWMYSVNGDFPNYGFSDCYPQDGAELRIQFTLNYGEDIGGGGALGGGS